MIGKLSTYSTCRVPPDDLHAKFEPLHYDCRPAFLVAESDGSALLYSLDSFRSWQAPIDDIRITRGEEREVKNMFDEWTLSRPKECNSEKASAHLTTNDPEEFL